MKNPHNQQISEVRRMLFEGDLLEANRIVENMRATDPLLKELIADFHNNMFGIFVFHSHHADKSIVEKELLKRYTTVLKWFSLREQIPFFHLSIEARDICPEILQHIKWEQLDKTIRPTVNNIVGSWLAHQKCDEVAWVLDNTDIDLYDTMNNPMMVYKNNNSRGAFAITAPSVPIYANLAFNYTPELFEFVRARGVSLDDISRLLPLVDQSRNPYNPEIFETYKANQFEQLRSTVERLKIHEALVGRPNQCVGKRKM